MTPNPSVIDQQTKMFKVCAILALVSAVLAAPAPEPKAKPGLVAAAYTAPVVAAPIAAAPVAYTAPVGYVAPAVFNAGYTAYAPYSGSLVVV